MIKELRFPSLLTNAVFGGNYEFTIGIRKGENDIDEVRTVRHIVEGDLIVRHEDCEQKIMCSVLLLGI